MEQASGVRSRGEYRGVRCAACQAMSIVGPTGDPWRQVRLSRYSCIEHSCLLISMIMFLAIASVKSEEISLNRPRQTPRSRKEDRSIRLDAFTSS